jgi:hypothetical protein
LFGYYTALSPLTSLRSSNTFVQFSVPGSFTDPLYFFASSGGLFTLYVRGKTAGEIEAFSKVTINVKDCSSTIIDTKSAPFEVSINYKSGTNTYSTSKIASLFSSSGGNTTYCVVDLFMVKDIS